MNGVNILSTVPAQEHHIGFIIIGALAILLGICILLISIYDCLQDGIIGGICVSVIGIVLIVFGIIYKCPERYKITFYDRIDFNEFNEHYKIIDQEGQILTVELIKGFDEDKEDI